jgi:porphobilinogen synthase
MTTLSVAPYPYARLRRVRQNSAVRDLFQENHLLPSDLIWPIFIRYEMDSSEISTMPGVLRYLLDELPHQVEEAYQLGIRGILLFPKTPDTLKTEGGGEAFNPNNLICQAIRAIKAAVPDMIVFSDVALDPYTTHGHDGLLNSADYVENDSTIDALVKQALNQVAAGADGICPSDMMDGRIKIIREALEAHGHYNTLLISYAVKYASCFYGPFRSAVGSKLRGDKKSYQLNPANSTEALLEVQQDIQEGADGIIIKPGLPYLDIISQVKNYGPPIWAYQVSGEYAMIKFAAAAKAIDEKAAFLETCISFKRAGASKVITYAAKEIAKCLIKNLD